MRTTGLLGIWAVVLGAPASAAGDADLAFFGALEAGVATDGTPDDSTDSFRAAVLDIFASSNYERWSFLSELVLEAGENNELVLDAERIEVGYLYREWLRVRAGRSHSALGYYNDTYHHGAYFMIPTDRPTAVGFEDDGGLLPTHAVGIHFDGRISVGAGAVRYDLEISNGRGPNPRDVLNANDLNQGKATNLRLRYEAGGAADGLLVGANLAVDRIPASIATAEAPHGALREWIIGVHGAYQASSVHLVTEGYWLQRTDPSTHRTHRTLAGFVEAARTFDAFTPYARYEWTSWPNEPELYSGATGTSHVPSLGLRYLVNDQICLKAESALHLGEGPTTLTAKAQLAFAF